MFKTVRKLERLFGAAVLTAAMIMPGVAFAVSDGPKGMNYNDTFMGRYGVGTTSEYLQTYSLDKAEFTFYTSEEAAKSGNIEGIAKTVNGNDAVLTMDWTADGSEESQFATAGVLELELGDYWVVETTVPEGCEIDPDYTAENPRKITVAAGSTADNPDVFTAADPVITGQLPKLKKSIAGNAGNTNVEGMIVEVRYFDSTEVADDPDDESLFATWYFKTDANGEIDFNTDLPLNEAPYTSANLFSYVKEGETDPTRVWPLGTYYFVEVKAPDGLEINEDNEEWITFYDDFEASDIEWSDDAVTGGIFLEKTDADTEGVTPQGAATLEGATFAVYNYGDADLEMDGKTYKSMKSAGFNKVTDAVCLMTTETGTNEMLFNDTADHVYAWTDDVELPSGTYIVVETAGPDGYKPSDRAYVVTISKGSSLDDEYNWVNTGELKWIAARTDTGFTLSDTKPEGAI